MSLKSALKDKLNEMNPGLSLNKIWDNLFHRNGASFILNYAFFIAFLEAFKSGFFQKNLENLVLGAPKNSQIMSYF